MTRRNVPRMFVLGAVSAGRALMMASSISQLVTHPLAHTESRGSGVAAQQAPADGAMPEFALNEELAGEVSALMSRLKENPNDAETLTALGDAFLRARDWNRAEVFLTRATLSKPGDIRPRYMLGIAQYQQGRLAEAVTTFEQLLTIQEDPATLYNLAIIYKYQVKNAARAEELLKRAVASPEADADVVEKAKKELE